MKHTIETLIKSLRNYSDRHVYVRVDGKLHEVDGVESVIEDGERVAVVTVVGG
jgi:sulfur carrier protein ThiS